MKHVVCIAYSSSRNNFEAVVDFFGKKETFNMIYEIKGLTTMIRHEIVHILASRKNR